MPKFCFDFEAAVKMRCCVQNCINNTKKATKINGITFHVFPKEQSLKSTWIKALGKHDWELKEHSVICSKHFKQDAFYETKGGLRRIRHGAVPVLAIKSNDDLEASAALKVCRMCLAIDVKMYHITDFNLSHLYEEFTGIIPNLEDRLPKMVCWECVGRLMSAKRFKDKALRCYSLLEEKFNKKNCMTIRDVKLINRSLHKLQSPLNKKSFGDDKCDLMICEDEIIKVDKEVECADNISEGNLSKDNLSGDNLSGDNLSEDNRSEDNLSEDNLSEDNLSKDNLSGDNLSEDNRSGDNLSVDNNDNTDDMVPVVVLQVMDEKIFWEKYTAYFISEDIKNLSEAYKEKNAKKRKYEVKSDKAKKVLARISFTDDDTPLTTMENYKNISVRRRKTNDLLDESLFTITALTYDEQIAEVQARQTSAAYRTAPHKCALCYRGFYTRHRYDVHVVRHSEKWGAFECFICKRRIKTATALRKHLTTLHTEQYSCRSCPFVTRNLSRAKEHEKWHAGTKYQCSQCARQFDKVTTYMNHMRRKHVSSYVCELCGYTFVSQKGIDVHKKLRHRLDDKNLPLLEGPYCVECDVRFLSEEAHARHLKLSSRHSSDDDPNRIKNDSERIHMNPKGQVGRRSERRPVTCEQCGIQLQSRQLYARHFMLEHPDKNRTDYNMRSPCMCEQCGRFFQCITVLKAHMSVHSGEKRFQCDQCDKKFYQKSNLVMHMRVHSASRPSYECAVCGKHFAFAKNRRRHMFVHTGLRPFKCETCGKCFTTAGEQRSHVDHVHLKKPWPKRTRVRAPRGSPETKD